MGATRLHAPTEASHPELPAGAAQDPTIHQQRARYAREATSAEEEDPAAQGLAARPVDWGGFRDALRALAGQRALRDIYIVKMFTLSLAVTQELCMELCSGDVELESSARSRCFFVAVGVGASRSSVGAVLAVIFAVPGRSRFRMRLVGYHQHAMLVTRRAFRSRRVGFRRMVRRSLRPLTLSQRSHESRPRSRGQATERKSQDHPKCQEARGMHHALTSGSRLPYFKYFLSRVSGFPPSNKQIYL